MDISGKVAVVTGGGSGLGKAAAIRLAGHGARIVVFDLDGGTAEEAANEIGGAAYALDVADAGAVERAVADISSNIGVPQVLINCAGVGAPAKIVGKEGPLPLEVFEKTVRINLVGTFNTMRVIASAIAANIKMQDRTETVGVVINTASIAAYDGQIGQPAYAASKAGVVGLTLPSARELGRYGIRVLTIAPGLFLTPMLAQLPPEAREALSNSVPFPPRLGEADEFAMLAHHLIENDMMNGETIRIDGCNRLHPK